jgi:fatty-acyl-CoA synthase
LSYRQLADEVERTARGLHALGVRRGDKVAVLMGNRAEWVVSALAITSIGAVLVAVNTWSTARELAYVLEHSEASVLVLTPTYLRYDYRTMLVEQVLSKLRSIVAVSDEALPTGWIAWEAMRQRGSEVDGSEIEAARRAVHPTDLAYLVYTSGSTSAPKGAQLLHEGLVVNPWRIGERQGVTERDRLWLAVSLFWGFGCINALLNVLSHGACLVLQESFDAAQALELIERERCTLFYGTPNMAQAMAEHPDRVKRDLSSLRAGAAFGSREQMQRVVDLGARHISNVYGLTEVYGNSHVTAADDPLELRLRCVGRPLDGMRHRIVAPATGLECATGEIGEIRIKGWVCAGYYKDPDTTAQAFDAEGWFRTGDLGMVDIDGCLHFRGRLKEIVKTGGISVSPAEIEDTLMTHPSVQLALVVGVPDAVRDEILAAVIVPRPGRTASEAELTQLCKDRLAAYKVPKRFHFASESELPLTTTGKVQKNRVAERFFVRG